MRSHTSGDFREFPRTTSIWGLVEQLKAGTSTREALQALLLKYRGPLKAHLVCSKKLHSDAADDLLQDFILSKILGLKLMERADREKGRFRSFLLTALDNFLKDEYRKGADPVQSLGEMQIEAAAPEENDAFDVAWAKEVIEAAVTLMREECQEKNRPDIWGVFDDRLLGPYRGLEAISYEEIVAKYRLGTAAQASNVLMTSKRMFYRATREVVREYEEKDEDITAELEYLEKLLQRFLGDGRAG